MTINLLVGSCINYLYNNLISHVPIHWLRKGFLRLFNRKIHSSATILMHTLLLNFWKVEIGARVIIVKQALKKIFFSDQVKPLRIKYGLAKGIIMNIHPLHKLQRLYGLDEAEIAGKFKEYAQLCSVFVDVGANDGYYSLCYKSL